MNASRSQAAPAAWRHVIITGGANGLGAALAMECALAGAHVSLLDRQAEALAQTRAVIIQRGGSCSIALTDVGDHEQVRKTLDKFVDGHGPYDVLFLCAAIGGGSWVHGISAGVFRSVITANLIGVVNVLEHGVPHMAARRHGTIVLVSSLLDVHGYPGTAAYSASKAGLRSVANSTRILCSRLGVRVVLVRPGFMHTGLATGNSIRMPGIMSAQAAARLILKRLHSKRYVITFPRWFALAADALRFLPRPLYDAIARRAMTYEEQG